MTKIAIYKNFGKQLYIRGGTCTCDCVTNRILLQRRLRRACANAQTPIVLAAQGTVVTVDDM